MLTNLGPGSGRFVDARHGVGTLSLECEDNILLGRRTESPSGILTKSLPGTSVADYYNRW